MAKKRDFGGWFLAQFGPEPSPGKSGFELEMDVSAARGVLQRAERRLVTRERWETQRQAALYAWSAAKEKEGKRG